MSIPIPPSTGFGFAESPHSPDYINLQSPTTLNERTSSGLSHGDPWNKGVPLTKETAGLPLEVQFAINYEKSATSRPPLLPLFKILHTPNAPPQEPVTDYYQELRGNLSEGVEGKLNKDEQLDSDKRDPSLVALDVTLRFAAAFLERAEQASRPTVSEDEALSQAIATYKELPHSTQQAITDFSDQVSSFIAQHLSAIGPNDPSHDLLMQVSTTLKEGRQKLYE